MNTCGQPRCSCSTGSAPTPRNREMVPDENFALAMAYVPMQHFHNVYELDEAMQYGTIFPELNKPFLGWKGGCRR